MELSEKHEPPCPSSQPRRPALKSPHGSRVDLDNLSGDDGSDMPLGEFPSSEAPHERLNPRRTTWGDERGHGLKITHHGAPRRTPDPLPHHARRPITRDHRTLTRTHARTHAHTDACARVPVLHAVYDTHYKRSFYRRHRFEICCASLLVCLVAMIAAVVLSLAGVR